MSKHSASKVASDDNLLREILFCLPVRSLLAFKSVSKRWLSLISDPYFTRSHYLRMRPTLSGIILDEYYPEYEFILFNENIREAPFAFLNFDDYPESVRIQHACNGLLFCRTFKTRGWNSFAYHMIYNPSTRQYATLSRPRVVVSGISSCSLSLAFDPIKSPHYKVVCIGESIASHLKNQIEIYSSETSSSWRLSGDTFTAHVSLIKRPGVFWNGSLHWINPGEPCLYYDVEKEVLSTMPMPTIPSGKEMTTPQKQERRFEYFGASRYHLHLIETYDHVNQLYFYEMENNHSGWSLTYRVNLDDLTISYPEMVVSASPTFHVLAVQEEEEELRLILYIPKKVISYNLKDKTSKKLKDSFGYPKTFHSFKCNSFQYIETLSSV